MSISFPMFTKIQKMITSIIITAVFSVGLAYITFPRFLSYSNIKATAVNVYGFFQRRA